MKILPIPPDWKTVTTVDMHAGGEPLRIVTSGAPFIAGDSIQAQFADAKANHQDFRARILQEPRGHMDMYGAILLPSHNEGADFGVLFMDTHNYTSMCGHGIIALTTYLAMRDANDVESHVVRYATPAGIITATALIENRRVTEVGFKGVTSYAEPRSRELDIPNVGKFSCDIAYGGELYAIVDIAHINIYINPDHAQRLVQLGRTIKKYIATTFSLDLYGVIFVEMFGGVHLHSRNVNVFGDGSIDRSPTGTGLCARLALHARKGDLTDGDSIIVASITGATFTGKLLAIHQEQLQFVTPYISGTAHLTGTHTFVFDPEDSLPNGFLLR